MARSHFRMRYENIAGSLLFIAGVLAFMGIITAEALYPGYSTARNAISDLGATLPPDSIIVEPSATIFNTTMVVSGLLIIAAAYCIHSAFRRRGLTVFLSLFGTGVLGVGIFDGTYGDIHAIFALLAFLAGGLSAVASSGIQRAPLSYFSVALGGISLLDLVLYYIMLDASPFAVLGMGGLERWIAYPILLWVTGFGGYMMGHSQS
ncbi:DUF998 domain-containing protein [Methanosarcina sp.]|uniref:DUF998 domain-containing protein n=1 Tax=Methanosarcina sp. TaxID=2213 RepID=UPI002ABAE041|nr:DUF998 domain-containing protein [Methanosarcina sp.]MDY9926797.1 DUF998 domain-containing protein [Methanosarcina sp.]